MPEFTWSRFGGYECSTHGDRRFSAFNARMPDGRTIEMHYQCDVKGYDPGGVRWWRGKGKAPLLAKTTDELWAAYLALWQAWATRHPKMMAELADLATQRNHVLSDRFARSEINQAHALSVILNELSEI